MCHTIEVQFEFLTYPYKPLIGGGTLKSTSDWGTGVEDGGGGGVVTEHPVFNDMNSEVYYYST